MSTESSTEKEGTHRKQRPTQQPTDRGQRRDRTGPNTDNQDAGGNGDTGTSKKGGEIERLIFRLRFDIGKSQRYHQYRSGFFSTLNDVSVAASLMAGSAVMAQVIKYNEYLVLGSGLVVVAASVLSLVFKWSDKARLHEGLYRRYTGLLAKMTRLGTDMTEKDIDRLTAKFHAIETDEPREKKMLTVICHNEQCSRCGVGGKLPVRWYQSWFAQLTDLRPYPWLKPEDK